MPSRKLYLVLIESAMRYRQDYDICDRHIIVFGGDIPLT